MKIPFKIKHPLILLLILLQSAIAYSQVFDFPALKNQEVQAPPSGKWEGKIQLPGTELRVFFQIEESASEKFRARMASPDQGANNIPVESVSWKQDSLYLDVKVIGGSYAAKLSADKSQFEGLWRQGGGAFPLNLKKVSALQFYPKRPQEPQRPFPYKEENVKYQNKSAGITLGGTLTIPEGKGPFPTVLLITGSGSQNRDEEIMGHKPFLVLADYLTRRGIAVLRVDDRGVGESSGDAFAQTSEDNANDVLASLAYLKSRPEVARNTIGLVGHSEGGMIAPMVASQSKDVSFIVLLAGVGFPGDQLHRRQVEDIMRLAKSNEEDIQKALALNEKLYAVIKSEKSTPSIENKLLEVIKQHAPGKEPEMKQITTALAQPWFRYFINFDPVPYLKKVNCPVLAISGSKDIQVASKENLAAIKAAITKGGNSKVTIRELPGLNHLFQTAETGSITEYAKIEETFSPVALKLIGDWIEGLVK